MVIGRTGLTIITFFLAVILLSLLGYLFFIKPPIITPSITLSILSAEEVKEAIDDRPIIAILLSDFGINKLTTSMSLDLPSQINLGISAYNLNQPDTYQLKNNILFNIPLSPISYTDNPSLKPLNSLDSEVENLQRLDNFLNQAKSYQAVYTDEDETYTKDASEAEFFLSNLKQRGLIYLCGLINKNAVIYKIAEKIGFHILANDVILDKVLSTQDINNKLKELESIALKQGYAVAKASSYQLTIEALKAWLPSLATQNIRLVSIEEFYKITYSKYLKKSTNEEFLELSVNTKIVK
jgi:polysaccharide deacetylase 2 family uncharacterized protein YibQ